jgi:hypothetical protein
MLKQILEMYLGYFTAHGESAIKVICNCKVPSDVILMAYKKLSPIELMPENDKKELKKYVIELFPEKTTKDKLNCCKIIYTIGTLL